MDSSDKVPRLKILTNSHNVLLIGGDGYIGSHFKKTRSDIVSIDVSWYSECDSIDYNDLTVDYLNGFSDIVLLAGHSSVAMCKDDFVSTYSNNIRNFGNLLSKIGNQKIIYASSSSIYNGCVGNADETFTDFKGSNCYDISKYTIDQIASMSNKRYYGLRFGTVNGPSDNMRWELMINKMVYDAVTTNSITVNNESVRRPILFTDTLSECLSLIIDGDGPIGYYNLCNVNSTIIEYATVVMNVINENNITKRPVVINNMGSTQTYDFAMNTDKFSTEFGYEFNKRIDNIVLDLTKIDFRNGNRNERKLYY